MPISMFNDIAMWVDNRIRHHILEVIMTAEKMPNETDTQYNDRIEREARDAGLSVEEYKAQQGGNANQNR
jgi:hypothetical protein